MAKTKTATAAPKKKRENKGQRFAMLMVELRAFRDKANPYNRYELHPIPVEEMEEAVERFNAEDHSDPIEQDPFAIRVINLSEYPTYDAAGLLQKGLEGLENPRDSGSANWNWALTLSHVAAKLFHAGVEYGRSGTKKSLKG